jgi:hypothetical protein
MNKSKSSFFQRNTNRLKSAFPVVSKGFSICIGFWVAWMVCFNHNPEATQALPVAYFFLEASKTNPTSNKDEDKLTIPREKLQ